MIDITVSTTGSDDSGLGTASAPYRTITKALTALSHGRQINVLPGEYVEAAPLVVTSLDQARIVSVERGGATVQIADAVTTPSVFSLQGCTHCVLDGFAFKNHPGGVADGGAVRVIGGGGNLLADLSASWTAIGLPFATALSLFEITASADCMIRRCAITDAAVVGSGVLVGIRVTDSAARIAGCSITAAARGTATARGLLLEATQVVTVRVEDTRVVDLETWNDSGAPPDCIGMRVDVAGSGALSLVVRDVMIARPRAIGLVSSVFQVTRGNGLRVACQDSVDVEGLTLVQCGVGFDGIDVPNASKINRVTAHQCGTALRSSAPAPPSRYIVRNASFSGCDVGITALGRAGETFFDVDFANFYQTEHWFTAADPLASSFELGAHLTEFIPLYNDAENLDFTPANVSGLVNRGGDF